MSYYISIDEENNIYNHLCENGIYVSVYSKEDCVAIDISWGDWKHEHLACSWVMEELGYYQFNQTVTEEDGSDCYSAIHYYKKEAA